MKPIILIDYSSVITLVGISWFLSKNLAPLLTITSDKTRALYKEHSTGLMTGTYPISSYIKTISSYLRPDHSPADLLKIMHKSPPYNRALLSFLKPLKEQYTLILISDVYPEMGGKIVKQLHSFFDSFIFSFEEGSKKSKHEFWESVGKKIDLTKVVVFIDDKEKNIELAESFWVPGIIYDSFETTKTKILQTLDLFEENILL